LKTYFASDRVRPAPRYPQTGLVRASSLAALAALVSVGFSDFAQSKELDDNSTEADSTLPNVYLDLRTYYTTLPANTLSIGLGASPAVVTLPTLSSSSRSIAVDAPLTVDLNDRLTIYGGVSASASQSGLSDWSTFAINSWNMGFQADVYQQNGGSIPTITLQSTVTKSVPDSPLTTTSFNNVVEFDYALNKDETKGLLAGVQYTRVAVASPLATVNPNVIGYVGGYYQWPNNWKFTGRIGVQSFGGAQVLNLIQFQPFMQPIIRVDLDRNDDNDNRLFGVTAQIAWTPKPAYQLIVRTPLYAIRN